MSYILEALKKAEAERNGSAAQAMHAPPSFAKAGGRQSSGPRTRRRWFALAATACALLGLLWFGTLRDKPQPVAAKPLPAAARTVALSPPVTAVADPKPTIPEMQEEKFEPTARVDAPKKASVKKQSSATAKDEPKPTPTAQVEPPVATLRELPEAIQREIPTLTIGGYIYSGNKADRSVLINSRLLRDGEEIAPGLQLEKMTPSGMVLNYKGYRYRTSY